MSDTPLHTLMATVQAAAASGQPLRIVGAGTKDFLGGPLHGQPLSVAALRGIASYEPTELVVTARAGTPLAELEAALAEKGQCLPFEPPRLGPLVAQGGTVGGMVAAGLAGPSRASVGGVRDYVLGASLVNGRGELLHFGGQVMKNVAGYDVSRLLAGSMGVLGVIAEVSLKVLPQPLARCTLRFQMDQAQALHRLNDWAGQPLPLNASAWWDNTLVLRLSGAVAAVDAARRKLGGEVIAPELAETFWNGLRDQRDEFFIGARTAVAAGATLWRLSVAPTAPKLQLPGEQLIEWGGAQRWVVTTAAPSVLQVAAAEGRGHAIRYLGGLRNALEGDAGAAAAGWPSYAALSAPLLRIHQQIKQAFDPAGIFNPQRLHPAL